VTTERTHTTPTPDGPALDPGADARPGGRPRGLLVVRLPRPRRPTGTIALAVLVGMGAIAVAAPLLTPFDSLATDTSATALPPGSPDHLLGTDLLGRDLLTRLLYGARTSLLVGLVAAAITVLAGTVIGALAAVGPRRLDEAITRVADTLLSLPLLVVVLALSAVAGPSLGSVIVAIAVTSWMPVALVARTALRTQRERRYVRAARSLGLSPAQVLGRHLLPGAIPPVASIAAFEVGHAILTESTLSFLGLGIPPNRPSWGNLLTEAQSHLLTGQWYTVAFPAVAIVITIVAVNALAATLARPESSAW